MSVDNFKFINHRGLSLSGRIYSGNSNHKSGLIFSHGLFSSKDGYKNNKNSRYHNRFRV